MDQESRGVGLRWRIIGGFVGLISLLGLVVVGIVYELTGRILRGQLNQQASVIAINLSDGAAGFVLEKNVLRLDVLITKYSLLKGVAYTFIEDRKGKIVAHSLRTFPPQLRKQLTLDERRQIGRRTLNFQGKTVYETRVPILEGQVGAAHVGIWGDAVEQEIYRALLPIVELIIAVLLAGVVLSAILARGIIRPIRRLTDIAGNMSTGDLDTPVRIKSRGEIGELARSLERMRASLKAAMIRLNRTPI